MSATTSGDPNTLMVMGTVMIGAIGLNDAQVGLDTITLIARLTGEYEVIVVPADSERQDASTIWMTAFADPLSVSGGRLSRRNRTILVWTDRSGSRRRSRRRELCSLFRWW
ncbi:MAG: hypothetical protein R2839_12165 [Thermomicrobiales bacterium]